MIMMAMTQPAQRDMATAFKRGVLGRCPNCGKGKLFRAYLKVADSCNVCGSLIFELNCTPIESRQAGTDSSVAVNCL